MCVLCECVYQVVLTLTMVCAITFPRCSQQLQRKVSTCYQGAYHTFHTVNHSTQPKSQHTINTTHPNALRMSSWSREVCFSCNTVLTSSGCVGVRGKGWKGRAVQGESGVYTRQTDRGMLATLITLLIQCCFQRTSEHQRV